ncbi:hypothetical protein LTR93_006320 [Exophiala xenobiotica]|nr:hypothetical protein LTR93_006320 [Exophiala xenobiotica]
MLVSGSPPNVIVGTPICGFLTRKAPNGKVPAPLNGETISRCTINPSSLLTIRELGDVLHSLTDEVQGDESVLSFWAVKSEFKPFGEAKEEHESKVEIFARFASQEAGTSFWDKGGRYEQIWDKIKRAGGTMLEPEYFSRLSGFLDCEEPEA